MYGRINMRKSDQLGVTLIEILLILVIIASVMATMVAIVPQRSDEMRINKATAQIQQILNAGLSYYFVKGQWPQASSPDQVITTLQTAGFLPGKVAATSQIPINNPWGNPYNAWANTYGKVPGGTSTVEVPSQVPQSKFYVYTDVSTNANAQLIAGRLPGSFVTDDNGTKTLSACTNANCFYVVSSVDLPGQNLSNASSINFGSIYHSGACVPVPSCPTDKYGKQLTPQIFVIPVGVSGSNDVASTSSINVYPISSFTALAYGPNTSPQIPSCSPPHTPTHCLLDNGTPLLTGTYWRVCLYVTTKKGAVSPTDIPSGQAMGNILALTRCAPDNENIGSHSIIWQP